jgi:hypothetical protein
VSSDLPKKPVWDQSQLSEIAQRISASGDNPAEFLDITYKVAERKYTAWPENLRTIFEPARTLKTGKPTFRTKFFVQALLCKGDVINSCKKQRFTFRLFFVRDIWDRNFVR